MVRKTLIVLGIAAAVVAVCLVVIVLAVFVTSGRHGKPHFRATITRVASDTFRVNIKPISRKSPVRMKPPAEVVLHLEDSRGNRVDGDKPPRDCRYGFAIVETKDGPEAADGSVPWEQWTLRYEPEGAGPPRGTYRVVPWIEVRETGTGASTGCPLCGVSITATGKAELVVK